MRGAPLARGARSRLSLAFAAGSLAWQALAACDAPGTGAAPSVEFGVFYGGQVQEREELPLQPGRLRHGLRVTLPSPAREALEVRWAIGKPGTGRRLPDARGRKARHRELVLGRGHFRRGEAVFEQPTPFAASDPPGLWNIRVWVADELLLERPFLVYDPVERARAISEADAAL